MGAGELAQAVEDNRNALMRVSEPDVAELVDVMASLKRELRRELRKLARREDVGTFNVETHQARATFVQLDKLARGANTKVERKMLEALRDHGGEAGRKASAKLARIVRAGAREFPGSVRPLRLDVAAIVGRAEKNLWQRWTKRAHAFGADVERSIRRDIMSGILRGESVDQMASRVLRGTGLIRRLKGETAKQLDAIADKPFSAARSHAEMIVRTETVNAYNTVQVDEIREANETDPGYLLKWDAAADRVCPYCLELDGTTCEIDGTFADGVPYPPLHPRCRCAVVAWRKEWKL